MDFAFSTAGPRYRALSPKSREYFRDLGEKANLAWRHGYKAFGPSLHSTTARQRPGAVLDSGTIVAADAPRQEHLSILLPSLTCKFEKGIKDIRREQRQLNAAVVKQEKDDALALETVNSEMLEHGLGGSLCQESGLPIKEIFAEAFRDAAPGEGGGHRCNPCHVASFRPPLIDFVAVSRKILGWIQEKI